MLGYLSELLYGPQYTGLSAYLPDPLAQLTSITLCYDIGTIACFILIILVSRPLPVCLMH